MKLFELDPKNPIDKELARTAKGAGTAGSLDPNDQAAQPDPEMGAAPGMGAGPDMNQPEPGMGSAPGEQQDADANIPTKPVDSSLMARAKNHDYVHNFDHSDPDSPSNPVVIMGMEMSDLSQLRNKIRVRLDQIGIADTIGKYSEHTTRATQSMLAFVDIVMAYKKGQVRDQNQKAGGRPKVKEVPKSSVKAGNYKPKRK